MDKNTHNHIRPIPPVPPIPPMPPFAPIPPTDGIPHPAPHRHSKPRNHSARFMPMLLHPHIPHHFNFWCNKIIPLAYDDSLSYYEVIAKTVDYLNNMLNDEKMLAINIEELAQAFCELQGFVNDYFAFYQSKGLIVYDVAVNNTNYSEILANADTAQMNTVYRIKFVEGSTQSITANLPESAKPYSGNECLLFNVSNFDLKRVGNEWVEISDDEKEYNTTNNYQLFITDRDIYFRENNGDSWGEWQSIFGNWWASEFENVKQWAINYVTPLITDVNTRLQAEIARATAAEQALDTKIEAETTRATNAENALSVRLVAEYERAVAAEQALDDKIEAETDRAQDEEADIRADLNAEVTRATAAEGAIRTDLNSEITRATAAEQANSQAITAETSRATTAENALSQRIQTWETDLAQERNARINGDTANANAISAEVTRAQAAETALGNDITANTNAITAEVTRAQAAETANANAISAEVTRAQAAETANANAISAEVTRAQAAETANANAISVESVRAQNAENSIRNNFIPNNGNDLSDDSNSELNIKRMGTIVLEATEDNAYIKAQGDITLNADSEDRLVADGDGVNIYSANTDTFIDVGRNNNSYITVQVDGSFVVKHDNAIRIDVDSDGVQLNGIGGVYGEIGFNQNNIEFYNGLSSYITISDGDEIKLITGGDKAYYQKGNPHSLVATEEIATIGDLSSATSGMATQSWVTTQLSGYIPNAGNDLSATSGSSLDIKRNGNIVIEGVNGNANAGIEIAPANDYGSMNIGASEKLFISCGDYETQFTGDYDINVEIGQNVQTRLSCGADGVKIIQDNDNYIDVGLDMTDYITAHCEGAIDIFTEGEIQGYSGGDTNLSSDGEFNITASTYMGLSAINDMVIKGYTGVYIDTYTNHNIVVNIGTQQASGTGKFYYTHNGVMAAEGDEVATKGDVGYISGVVINTSVNSPSNDLDVITDDWVSVQDKYHTDNERHIAETTAIRNTITVNTGLDISANSSLTAAEIAATPLRFKESAFEFTTSSGNITINGGKDVFEDCTFVANSYVGNDIVIDNSGNNDTLVEVEFRRCNFINCDVKIQSTTATKVTIDECYSTNDLSIATASGTSATAIPRIKVYGSRFDGVNTGTGTNVYDVVIGNNQFATGTGALANIMSKYNNVS